MSVIIQFTPNVTPPPPPAPVAPDESLTTTQGTSVSVTPVITQGGNPVAPDSLVVVDQPTHGTASVDGVSLVYAPSLGYFGTDSFTYKAWVSATESNIATVSVGVAPSSISIRQQTTHRAYRHYDSPITCHVRNESGRLDLSAATLEVYVRNLDRQCRALRTLSATGDANGVVSFIIPKGTFYAGTMGADYQLGAGDRRANNFKFEVTANGALIYDALLEVV